jgi:hypothetical protein
VGDHRRCLDGRLCTGGCGRPCFRTDCRVADEVVAIVMTCSSQAMQRREDRTPATRRCLADFRRRTGGPSGSTIELTAVDLRRRGVGWIASITSGGGSVKRLCTAAVGIADFDRLAAIQPNRAVWRPASVHCPALARFESFRLAGGGLLLSKWNGHRSPSPPSRFPFPKNLAFARRDRKFESISLQRRVGRTSDLSGSPAQKRMISPVCACTS